MNRILLALLLSICSRAASAQDSTTVALLKLEDRWAAALVRRDTATFQQLLAPKFVYTENDHLYSRAEVLHEVGAGSDTVKQAHNEEMQVHRFGPHTAVVTGWLVVGGRGAGSDFLRRYRFTDTWVRRKDRWQIVAAQDYLAPAAKP
jgi:ketosteroid isomerase-like protein